MLLFTLVLTYPNLVAEDDLGPLSLSLRPFSDIQISVLSDTPSGSDCRVLWDLCV